MQFSFFAFNFIHALDICSTFVEQTVSWSWTNQPTWPMHLSYNELHRQAGKLSFCHRNITENHNIEDQQQQLVWPQCLRQTLLVNLLMEKFYPWTSTLFQGSITRGQIVIKVFYGYFFKFHKLKHTMKVVLQNLLVAVSDAVGSREFCVLL